MTMDILWVVLGVFIYKLTLDLCKIYKNKKELTNEALQTKDRR